MEFIRIAFLLFCLVAVFFYKCLFFGLALVPADILTYFYPWKLLGIYPQRPYNPFLGDTILGYYPLIQYSVSLLKNGVLALWNPYLYSGCPLLASNDAFVFSPLSLLALFMPIYKAVTLYIILQIFLSGVLMYLFLRKGLGLNKFSCLCGAVVYMFNGHFIVWLNHIGFVGVLMWFPLALLLLEKMIAKRRIIYALFAGIILGLQFYCGFLQASYYLLLGSGLYGLIRIFQEYYNKRRLFFISLFHLALAFAIGLSLGAIQLLPSLELLILSHRQPEVIPFSLVNPACLLALLTFIFPDIFGNPIHNNYWGPANYVELCGYIGIIPLILFFVAARQVFKDKRVLAFLAIALFALGVYLQTPLNNLLCLLPGFNRDLSGVRIICLFTFSASVLAGLGLEYMRKLNAKSLFKVQRNIFVYSLLILLFCLSLNFLIQVNKDYIMEKAGQVLWPQEVDEFVDKPDIGIVKQTFLVVFSSDWSGYLRYFYHVLRPTISISILTIFLFHFYVRKKKEFIPRLLLLLVIIADLFYFGMRFYSSAKPKLIFPDLDSVEFLKKDKSLYRVFSIGDTFVPNTLMAYGIQSEGGYLSLFPGRYEEFWGLIDKKIEGISYKVTDYNSKLLDLLNVKYFIGAATDEAEQKFNDSKFELVYNEGKEMRIYKNKNYLERAFFISDYKVLKDKREILKALADNNFKPDKTVILEEEPKVNIDYEALSNNLGQVNILDYAANSLLIDVDAPQDGFLVLGDSYYPGWQVYVDGQRAKIYRADYVLRALALVKGSHRVRFVYEPRSFSLGITITSLALISTLAGICIARRQPG